MLKALRQLVRMALPLAVICFSSFLYAEDWPQFLGPRRDGSYIGPLAQTWPKDGPQNLWEKEVGAGFAGPVVADGKVYLFHRSDEQEKVDCFDAASGKLVWSGGYPATYRDGFGFDPGPRSPATVAGGRVFTYGADGIISAFGAKTGKELWRVDAKQQFGSKKGWFGRAGAPLVCDDVVMIDVGGDGVGIVGLEVASGKVKWKAGKDEASYASATVGVFDGKTNALFLTRHFLTALDPLNGKVAFDFPFAPREDASVTAATPLVDGNLVFLSACYGAGAAVLKIENNKPGALWQKDGGLLNHYSTSVHRNGLVFGFDGRQEFGASLVCIELKTGKPRWRKEQFKSGSVILAGDRLLMLLETGELVLAEVSGDSYKELQRAQVLGNQLRAHPALADGFLYARDRNKLVKLDLSK